MTNDQRILALAQSIYQARHNQQNDVTGNDLTDFLNQTIEWVNQLTPEIQKKADWNAVRTQDAVIGSVTVGTTISYALPANVRKLVINPFRDLTIRQDSSIVSTFKLVSPNQTYDPNDHSLRSRATVLKRKVIFSRPLNNTEVGGSIVADTIGYLPLLSHTNVALLDIFDEDYDFRQLYVYGVTKNQILPDIVQGGLTPSFSGKYADYLADCIATNNESADTNDADRESFAYVHGVGF